MSRLAVHNAPENFCTFCEQRLGSTFWPKTETMPVACMRCGNVLRLVVDREVLRRGEARSAFLSIALDMDRFIRDCLKEGRWKREDMADAETAFVDGAKAFRKAVTQGAVPRRIK